MLYFPHSKEIASLIRFPGASEMTACLLMEQGDVSKLQDGHRLGCGVRQTKGRLFDSVVISLHPTHQHICDELHHGHGMKIPPLPVSAPGPGQFYCRGCGGIFNVGIMAAGKCAFCWRKLAEKLEADARRASQAAASVIE